MRPTGREGHIFMYMNDKNKYILFSGISNTRYSDVFVFSMNDMKWEMMKPSGELPKEMAYSVGWYDGK